MRTFTVGDLQELLTERKGPCVSIFLPTHRDPVRLKEDRVLFKNLANEAREKLATVVAARAAPRLTAPLDDIHADRELWADRLSGLAVFVAPGFERHYRVPMELPERVIVADTFHVRPLIRYLQSTGRFYVLALGKEKATFFEGTREGLARKDVPDMPASIGEVVRETEKPGLSSHITGNSGGGQVAIFHGQSGPRSEREDLARWCRAIDRAVTDLLRDEQAPLVLHAVSRLQGIYRSVSRCASLLPDGVDGSSERVPREELFARTAPIAQDAMRRREDETIAEYSRKNGAMRSTDDIVTVAEAAVIGRVRRLLIARGRSVHGFFDRTTGEIRKRGAREAAYGDDVLDDVAEAVLARGGSVFVLERDRMPTKSPVAAVLRW